MMAHASFTDVRERHANREAIEYLQTKGMIAGYAVGTFKPDQLINRAEFTKIMIGAIATPEELANCDQAKLSYFADVPSGQWYSPYVCIGYGRGIIQGHIVSNGKPQFRPIDNMNTIGAAKIIALSIAYQEAVWFPPIGENWYKPFIELLAKKKAIPTSITGLEQYITRGEMAEMTYRVSAGVDTKPSHDFSDLEHYPTTKISATPSEWPTYKNLVVGYSMQYPPETGGMASNTFAIWEEACAVEGKIGPLDIQTVSKSEALAPANAAYYEYMHDYVKLPLRERAEQVWNKNASEASNEKSTGDLTEVTVNRLTGYRLWTTHSYEDIRGGQLVDGKTYVILFDDGDLQFKLMYSAAVEGAVKQMLESWQSIKPTYLAKNLNDAAKKCQLDLDK